MYIKVNDVNLFYIKEGHGKPLLLLHGNGESHDIFDKIIEPLSKQFTVYALDLRGCGNSSNEDSIGYQEMANDIVAFIQELHLETPILYGFSDGGIIGLLIASQYPDLLSKLIISGANTTPNGLKVQWRLLFTLMYLFKKDEGVKMMLTQPNITSQMLTKIQIPVLVLAGSRDAIKESDTKFIAAHIPSAELRILKGEGHASYVIHSNKLLPIIQDYVL